MLDWRCCKGLLRQGLAIILLLSAAGYLAFLLYSQYQAQSELNRAALERFVGENDKRYIAAAGFLNDRLHDIAQLAENRDIALYYENKALGMTMEYGLGASIEVAKDTFLGLIKRRRIHDRGVFCRIVYLDAGGARLIDVRDDEYSEGSPQNWRTYLKNDRKRPRFIPEKSGKADVILISHPVQFKGEYAGQLLAWLPVSVLYEIGRAHV